MTQSDTQPAFIRIAAPSEIPLGAGRSFAVGRYEVAVFNIDGAFYAIENACPHQGGPLADGWLEGPLVTCPWHGWCFDLRSGKMTLGEFARVPRFELQVRAGELYVATEPIEQ
ncbi:MAG TPA: Rieske 2Fe-2S domain-containing protein [Candidatus Baltobacteraceae bacterium]|nr:Rieske 2Fe-2S domain-containing protein [Candidatus Baltobacteraceae bacterium]